MRKIISSFINRFCIGISLAVLLVGASAKAEEFEFNQMNNSFKNFIRCELTRTSAVNPFKGKAFEITMIDLFDIQEESDLKIVTGAVQCFVDKKHQRLYVAVGLKEILGKTQVVCFTMRHNDFSILATELMRYPYKERCPWSEYWVDLD